MHFIIIIFYIPLNTITKIKLRAIIEYTTVECDFLENGKICIHYT